MAAVAAVVLAVPLLAEERAATVAAVAAILAVALVAAEGTPRSPVTDQFHVKQLK